MLRPFAVESGALPTIMPLWYCFPDVNCNAPEPAASCGAFAPHAGIEVLGVEDVPAVKHAPPIASHVFAAEADSVKGSLSSVVPVPAVSTRRRTTAERSEGRATARTAAGSKPDTRSGSTDAASTRQRARRTESLGNNRYFLREKADRTEARIGASS